MKKFVCLCTALLTVFCCAPTAKAADSDLIEIGETAYYFNSTTGLLEVAGDDYAWQPGDIVYIDIVGDDSQIKDSVRQYKVFAEYWLGKNLVEKLSIEYRKANLEQVYYLVSYTVTDAYELNGTYTFETTATPRKSAVEQRIKTAMQNDDNYRRAIASYKADVFGEFAGGAGHVLNNKYYATDSEIYTELGVSFVNLGYIKSASPGSFYFDSVNSVLLDAGYKNSQADAYVFGTSPPRYYTASEMNNLLPAAGLAKVLNGFADPGAGTYFDNANDVVNYESSLGFSAAKIKAVSALPLAPGDSVYVNFAQYSSGATGIDAVIANAPGAVYDHPVTAGYTNNLMTKWYPNADSAIVAEGYNAVASTGFRSLNKVAGQLYYTYYPTIISAGTNINPPAIGSSYYHSSTKEYFATENAAFTRANTPAAYFNVVPGAGFTKNDSQGKPRYYTSLEQLGVRTPTGKGFYNRQTHEIISSSRRDTLSREHINNQIREAGLNFTSTEMPKNKGSGYYYFVAVKTKYSNTVKELDLVAEITIGTSKTLANQYAGYNLNITMKSKRGEDIEGDLLTVKNEQTNTSFKNFKGKVYIEFGNDGEKAFYYGDVTNQRALNLYVSTDKDNILVRDHSYAELNFLSWHAKPTFTKAGELYIFADSDDYIYEYTDKGLKEVKAKYDSDYDAWVIKTKTLGSYVISDSKLLNLSGSEKPPAYTSPEVYGPPTPDAPVYKPNPNTGR